ncbi:MAG: thioredoxin [Chloroflexi bacterium]|nr:thioredoxin [Chloroflexota bacterium]
MKLFNIFKKNKGAKRYAIIDIGDKDFEQQVVRRSYKQPVMVDFWAAWCGPCRQLGPALEKVAEDPNSEFILAKLNTEHNKRTAAKYNIRSIPAVKLFRNGQVVAEFTGARPEALIRRFVDKATSASPPTIHQKLPLDKRVYQAEQHLKKGRGFEAFILLEGIAEDENGRAIKLLPLAKFLFDVETRDALTGLDELDDLYLDTKTALRKRKPAEALNHLFAALDIGEDMDRPLITGVIESIFTLLGEKSKITQQYQPQLIKS